MHGCWVPLALPEGSTTVRRGAGWLGVEMSNSSSAYADALDAVHVPHSECSTCTLPGVR